MGTHFLDCLFSPNAIAVFGASERPDAVGNRVFFNLSSNGFNGQVYAVNPKYKKVFGQSCYSSIKAVGEAVDLAVIATPARTISKIIRDCGKAGVRAAIVITPESDEDDKRGKSLEKSLFESAGKYNIRILGPDCLGLIRPSCGINATYSKNSAKPGQLALISQSGAICTSILDWATNRDIGFSAVVSLATAADISFGDILDYLAQDSETRSILLYLEGINDARSFMSGLRIAARMKPVVVIKAGRHAETSKAALTHTGAIVGADDVFDAALQRAGVVRAKSIEQLFAAAQLLASRHRVNGNRLAIVTNGGALGIMATDRAVDLGVRLACLTDETIKKLNKSLPEKWSHDNPINLLGDAPHSRYRAAVKACLDDPGVDGVLVMLSPQAMTDPLACAQTIINTQQNSDKPILACWMGEQQVEIARQLFDRHHLPSFPNPESSVEAFAYLTSHYQNQQQLMQVPSPLIPACKPDIDTAREIIRSVLAGKRSILTNLESKALLSAFSIPVTDGFKCASIDEVLKASESTGFPLAMKIDSHEISHKSDVGGICLNIAKSADLPACYEELMNEVSQKKPDAKFEGVTIEPMYSPPNGRELLIGVIRDPVFGPAITFGAGGVEVEVLRDRAVAIPPLNRFLVEKMISQTHVAGMLNKFRHMPAINMDALIQVLLHVSGMICELPEIIAMDINPLVADETGVAVLDARVVVEKPEKLPKRYSHMAIHPYPSHLESDCKLGDGSDIKIRPIRPEDATIEQNFVHELSSESKYFRFMQGLNELTQQMLIRFTQLDYSRELALIALQQNDEKETMLGVARYVTNSDAASCEFAVVVADKFHHKGIGSQLMNALIDAARQSGLKEMNGEILEENRNMQLLAKRLGFEISASDEDPGIMLAIKKL